MKQVIGYNDYYITKDGIVYSAKKDDLVEMKQHIDSVGYPALRLCENGITKLFRVHRLVLLTFIGPCPLGMEACHKDGNRTNSHVSNLYWGTRKQNQADRVKHGTDNSGERNPMWGRRKSK